MKRITIGIALVLIAVAAYTIHVRYRNSPLKVQYVTSPVEKGTVRSEITSTGTVRPLVEVLVGCQGIAREVTDGAGHTHLHAARLREPVGHLGIGRLDEASPIPPNRHASGVLVAHRYHSIGRSGVVRKGCDEYR